MRSLRPAQNAAAPPAGAAGGFASYWTSMEPAGAAGLGGALAQPATAATSSDAQTRTHGLAPGG